MCKVARLLLVCVVSMLLTTPGIVRANSPLVTTNPVFVVNSTTATQDTVYGVAIPASRFHTDLSSLGAGFLPGPANPLPDITTDELLLNNPITVTTLDNSGVGSLRWAISQANQQPGDDVINITAVGLLELTGTLEITSNIVINGPGAGLLTISGEGSYRVFSVNGAAINFWLSGVTLANGNATGGCGGTSQNGAGGGGAAGMGGALFIYDSAVVTVTGVVFDNNIAMGGDGGSVSGGGGVTVLGTGRGGGGGGGISGAGNASTDDTGAAGGSGGPIGAPGAGGAGGNLAVNGLAGGEFGGGGGGAGAFAYNFDPDGSGGAGGNGGFGGGGGGDAITVGDAAYGLGGTHGGHGGDGYASIGGGGGGGAGLGGAIFVRAGTLNLEDCVFSNNRALHGAGGTTYEQPDFLGANGQGKGGAIYIYDGVDVVATGVSFAGSNAQDGLDSDTDNQDWYGHITILDTNTLGIHKTTSANQVKPGDTVTFTLTYRNRGEVAATDVTLADIIPPVISVTRIITGGIRITDTSATPGYRWQVADVMSPTIGAITVTGVLTSPLVRGLVITNSATITGNVGTYTTSTSYVTLKVQNVAPVITATTHAISEGVALGTLVGAPISATDSNGDGISYGIASGNPGDAFTINAASGQIAVNNTLDFETQPLYVLTIQASDGLLTTTLPVTIAIADIAEPPYFTSTPVTTATEASAYQYHVTAVDPDAGSLLTITTLSKPSWLTATLSANMSGTVTGTLQATPGRTEVGTYQVVLQVEDQTGLTSTQSFSLTVLYVNHAPAFSSAPVTTATQGVLYTYIISATDQDLALGDVLTITLLAKPSWLTFTTSISNSATLNGTPGNDNVGASANNHVRLMVVDSYGVTVTQDFTITVANINDPPTFTSSPVTSATEDIRYTYVISTADLDVKYGDALTISALIKPSWLTFTPTTHLSATLSGIPLNANVGSNNHVLLQVIDSGGLTATQDFTITVANVNDRPLFVSTVIATATQDLAYTYIISTTDPDLDNGDGLTITWLIKPSWLTFTATTHCSATLNGLPLNTDVGVNGNRVKLQVADSGGLTDTQDFTITVANINDPPAFTSTPVTTATQGLAYSYVISTTDPDLPYGDALTITAVTKPAWLTFTAGAHFSATLSGTPTNGDVGNNRVTLQVIDKYGLTATQTFTLVVANINDPPTFTSTPSTIGLQDIPYTYTVRIDDPDVIWGDALTISVITKPGWLSFSQLGIVTASLTGTPSFSDLGEHAVELMAMDGAGMTATQRFTLTVYDQICTLVINTVGEGNAAVAPDKPFYIPGDIITLTVSMGWGWGFDGWSGDLNSSEMTWSNPITHNMEVTATFSTKRVFLPRVSR